MTYSELNHWLRRQIPVPKRLQTVCFGLVLFLMISARKDSLKAAGEFAGLHISQFSGLFAEPPGPGDNLFVSAIT